MSLKQHILRLKKQFIPWLLLQNWAKNQKIWGFGGNNLFEIVQFVAVQLDRDSIQSRSSAVAFRSLLALFPFAVFMLTVLSHIPISQFRESLVEFILFIMPYSIQQSIYSIIEQISIAAASNTILSASLFFSLYFASNSIRFLMIAFQKAEIQSLKESKFLQKQFLSLSITVLLLLILFVSIAGIMLGRYFIHEALFQLHQHGKLVEMWLLKILRWTMIFLLLFNSVALIYLLVPPFKHNWGYFSPGALLATILCIVSSTVFSFFVNNVVSANNVYGAIWFVTVIMVWFNLISQALIIGFEYNIKFKNV